MKQIFTLLLLTAVLCAAAGENPFAHRVVYVDAIASSDSYQALAASLNVPGYAPQNAYNVVNLAFQVQYGAADAAEIWANPTNYFGTSSPLGTTNREIRTNLRAQYAKQGVKIILSAFGATCYPTNYDAATFCGTLADQVISNNYDGIDLDYEDNSAMEQGIAEAWLIKCTITLRQKLPSPKYIITHAPQAPYFVGKSYYPNGGYLSINEQVGDLIDWYNVQFYNQGDSAYDSYETLFVSETRGVFAGTAVMEIVAKGVPIEKIVIGKPASQADAYNTGYVTPQNLYEWGAKAKSELGWSAGWMLWQFSHDA